MFTEDNIKLLGTEKKWITCAPVTLEEIDELLNAELDFTVNGNLKFLNSGKVKFPTCKFLNSRFRSYVDANQEAVPHVERFIQRRFKHQRDCSANRP